MELNLEIKMYASREPAGCLFGEYQQSQRRDNELNVLPLAALGLQTSNDYRLSHTAFIWLRIYWNSRLLWPAVSPTYPQMFYALQKRGIKTSNAMYKALEWSELSCVWNFLFSNLLLWLNWKRCYSKACLLPLHLLLVCALLVCIFSRSLVAGFSDVPKTDVIYWQSFDSSDRHESMLLQATSSRKLAHEHDIDALVSISEELESHGYTSSVIEGNKFQLVQDTGLNSGLIGKLDPPPTPEGKALARAAQLCEQAPFNLAAGRKFIYSVSAAVGYLQEARVKCAVAYAQIFREEDVPVVTRDILDTCASALLRYSPDECWADANDSASSSARKPKKKFAVGKKATIRGLSRVARQDISLKGNKSKIEDSTRSAHLRAERFNLIQFKFSLVSKTHLCPPLKRDGWLAKELQSIGVSPPKNQALQGLKHEMWLIYLAKLSAGVRQRLTESVASKVKDTNEPLSMWFPSQLPMQRHLAQKLSSTSQNEHNPPSNPTNAVVGNDLDKSTLETDWLSRGRGLSDSEKALLSLLEGGPAASRSGKIIPGAVLGGIPNPDTRYAALISYLQRRFQFRALKYEADEEFMNAYSTTHNEPSGCASCATLTGNTNEYPDVDEMPVDHCNEFHLGAEKASSRKQFIVKLTSNVGFPCMGSRGRKQWQSSCDLLPQDQAAQAAKAALECGSSCVDSGEDLWNIIEEGTEALPSTVYDRLWSAGNNSPWPLRLPQRPAAESLQRAYLNQLVSGCQKSKVRLREADDFHYAQAASFHFFNRFREKCLKAMDEMTLPLFTRALAGSSFSGPSKIYTSLRTPALYSGADQLAVTCAAAALVPEAMPMTIKSNATAFAEATAAAAAAAGAPLWGAPSAWTRAAMMASVFAYHHPGFGLVGRIRAHARIRCWELDATHLPPSMSQAEYRVVVTSFTELELRNLSDVERRFIDEHLVPIVRNSLSVKKIPVSIFAGHRSPPARAYILARYLRERFTAPGTGETPWPVPPPASLTIEDQTVKAVDAAVACGKDCTDIGQSVTSLLRDGVILPRKSKILRHNQSNGSAAIIFGFSEKVGSKNSSNILRGTTDASGTLKITVTAFPTVKDKARALSVNYNALIFFIFVSFSVCE